VPFRAILGTGVPVSFPSVSSNESEIPMKGKVETVWNWGPELELLGLVTPAPNKQETVSQGILQDTVSHLDLFLEAQKDWYLLSPDGVTNEQLLVDIVEFFLLYE
jgi:hypothetical protein